MSRVRDGLQQRHTNQTACRNVTYIIYATSSSRLAATSRILPDSEHCHPDQQVLTAPSKQGHMCMHLQVSVLHMCGDHVWRHA
eukprot:317728-Chlamydomonas_euryale.AAC.3